jgi:hypothetical protein
LAVDRIIPRLFRVDTKIRKVQKAIYFFDCQWLWMIPTEYVTCSREELEKILKLLEEERMKILNEFDVVLDFNHLE